jgi:hypothetical protein
MSKLSFIVGNANQGYMIKMCIYSFMQHNHENCDEIIISDNSSEDYSPQFYEENKYKSMTKVLRYYNERDRNPQVFYPHGMQWDLGLKNCKNEYAVICHADVMWRGNYIKFFLDKYYNEKPFIFGYGGGDGTDTHHRIHEWGMIINVQEWKDFGISFEGKFEPNRAYDTSAYMYKRALDEKKKLVALDYLKADNNEYFEHYAAGGKFRKGIITEIAKEWIVKNEHNTNI